MSSNLISWLDSLNLREYQHNFTNEGYDMELIYNSGLSDSDLDALNITKLGHRKKILQSLNNKSTSSNSVSSLFDCFQGQIASNLDHICCWDILATCEQLEKQELVKDCWEYIKKNTLSVINAFNFKNISKKHLIEFLQLDSISVYEHKMIYALNIWKKANENEYSDDLLSYIHFGVLDEYDLKEVESYNWIKPDYLYFALRKLVFPDLITSELNIPKDYFTNRSSIKVHLADNIQYKPKISDIYSGYTLSYDTLIDSNYNYPGVGTTFAPESWIEAEYNEEVTVSMVTVSAPTKGLFIEQGWAITTYINDVEIQVFNGKTWKTLCTTKDCPNEGPITFSFPKTTSNRWRLFKPNAYIATGTFILHSKSL